MALSNSQYDEILRGYDARQLHNKDILEARTKELHKRAPELLDIDHSIAELSVDSARRLFDGDKDALDNLKKQIAALRLRKEQIIKKLGYPANYLEAVYTCPDCKDTGYIDGKICDCIKSRAKAILIESLSESLPLNSCRFENFSLKYYLDEDLGGGNPRKRMEGLLKLCRDYVNNFSPKSSDSILFMGDAGLGKTHLSLSIVYELLNKGFDVVYGSAYNLFAAMENDHFSNRSNDSFNAAVSCDLLVIDDLGSEFVSPYIQAMFYNVVNTRLLSNKPTIINTNLTMQEIEQKYTPRISSRFIGSYTAKKFIGNDIRQIKMAEKFNG
jgi:DNA replication protein DnaC